MFLPTSPRPPSGMIRTSAERLPLRGCRPGLRRRGGRCGCGRCRGGQFLPASLCRLATGTVLSLLFFLALFRLRGSLFLLFLPLLRRSLLRRALLCRVGSVGIVSALWLCALRSLLGLFLTCHLVHSVSSVFRDDEVQPLFVIMVQSATRRKAHPLLPKGRVRPS